MAHITISSDESGAIEEPDEFICSVMLDDYPITTKTTFTEISAHEKEVLVQRMKARMPPLSTFDKLDTSILGQGPYSRLNKKIEMRGSTLEGGGLFAKEDLPAGEFVWADIPDEKGEWAILEGYMEEFVQLYGSRWEELKRYIYHERDNIYRGVNPDMLDTDFSLWMNHSCSPNVWYSWNEKMGVEVMETMKEIKKGEELTTDYGMMEGGTEWPYYPGPTFECLCGSEDCRGLISATDYKQPELQEKYKGHFHYYLEQEIERIQRGRETATVKQTL